MLEFAIAVTVAPMSPARLLVAVFLLLPVAAGAQSQVYKWVDERGVVNYSNQPPKNVPPRRLAPVEERINIYAPPPAEKSPSASVGASQPPDSHRLLRERIELLERELELQRRQRGLGVELEEERRQRAYEACIANRGVDCDRLREVGPFDAPATVIVPAHRIVVPRFTARRVHVDRLHAGARFPAPMPPRPHRMRR